MKIIHHEVGRDPLYKIWNASKFCMVFYFHSDGGNIVFQNKIYPIRKGALCFIRAGKQHCTIPDKPESYDRSKIFISEETVNGILKLTPKDKVLQELFKSSSVIYAQIPEQMHKEIENIYIRAELELNQRGDETAFIGCFLQLITYLRDYSLGHINNSSNRLTRVIDFINRNYSSIVTLDDICREVYISKHYLCRMFKDTVGMTIMEYLLKTRIAAAKNYLTSEEMSIGEISDKCGFSSVSYFSQVFKKNTGVSPHEYRKTLNSV